MKIKSINNFDKGLKFFEFRIYNEFKNYSVDSLKIAKIKFNSAIDKIINEKLK